jgi:hypothetical protein
MRLAWLFYSTPTVPLSTIGLRSVRWSTVTVPNIGHFRAILGSQKGVSGLLNGSRGLNGTVGLTKYLTFSCYGIH